MFVLKQEIWSVFWKILICFVPGRPGTKVFVRWFLLLPLSLDKRTSGQESFLSWDKRKTGRPVLVCHGMSRSVETLVWTKFFCLSAQPEIKILKGIYSLNTFQYTMQCICTVRLGNFKDGGSYKARFLAKNQHTWLIFKKEVTKCGTWKAGCN